MIYFYNLLLYLLIFDKFANERLKPLLEVLNIFTALNNNLRLYKLYITYIKF